MTSTWTDARVGRLTELWNDGVSAGLIAKDMNLGKNAVIGKAHRLRLPRRQSPIRYGGQTAPKKQIRSLAIVQASVPPARPESEATVSPAPAKSQANMPLGRGACQFIAGEKGIDFKLYVDAPRCQAKAKPGSPYCEFHDLRCHIKAIQRDAA